MSITTATLHWPFGKIGNESQKHRLRTAQSFRCVTLQTQANCALVLVSRTL